MSTVHSLYIYPIKSCAGVRVQNCLVTPQGLQYDRQWMIVHNDTGKMVTQRTHPRMTQIYCDIDATALYITVKGVTFTVPLDLKGDVRDSTVWKNTVKGYTQSVEGLNEMLSDFLETPVTVVRFFDTRIVASQYAPENSSVQYADSYPFTIADTGDMKRLNDIFVTKGLAPITVSRFRANIILDGVTPDVGTHHNACTVKTPSGDVTFTFCEPCKRCPIPDLDPVTGHKTMHTIQYTLRHYRNSQKDWFSTHSTLHNGADTFISVGDRVVIT